MSVFHALYSLSDLNRKNKVSFIIHTYHWTEHTPCPTKDPLNVHCTDVKGLFHF